MKYIAVILTMFIVSACSTPSREDNFWGKASPEIGKIINR